MGEREGVRIGACSSDLRVRHFLRTHVSATTSGAETDRGEGGGCEGLAGGQNEKRKSKEERTHAPTRGKQLKLKTKPRLPCCVRACVCVIACREKRKKRHTHTHTEGSRKRGKRGGERGEGRGVRAAEDGEGCQGCRWWDEHGDSPNGATTTTITMRADEERE